MNEALTTLEQAISDVGCWNWWVERFPECFQIEFSGVQLWNEPLAPGEPPSGILALRFTGLKCVCFLTREKEDVPDDWVERLKNDEFEQPPGISYEECTFDPGRLEEILCSAERTEVVFGTAPEAVEPEPSLVSLAFWAGSFGLAVIGEKMEILNVYGLVPLEDIVPKHQQWWEYWKRYWELCDTPQALPTDYACEVTIPAETLETAKGEL